MARVSSNTSHVVNNFETYLEEARKSETTPQRKPKKNKIEVAPGKSVTQVDLNKMLKEPAQVKK